MCLWGAALQRKQRRARAREAARTLTLRALRCGDTTRCTLRSTAALSSALPWRVVKVAEGLQACTAFPAAGRPAAAVASASSNTACQLWVGGWGVGGGGESPSGGAEDR